MVYDVKGRVIVSVSVPGYLKSFLSVCTWLRIEIFQKIGCAIILRVS